MKINQERINFESQIAKLQSQIYMYDSKAVLLTTEIERLSIYIIEKENEIKFFINRENEMTKAHSEQLIELRDQFEETMKIRIVNFTLSYVKHGIKIVLLIGRRT